MTTAIAGVTTPLDVPTFIAVQREARAPTFEALRKHLTTYPTEKEIVEASITHLPDEQQAELLKLAVKPPKRKRGRR